MRAGVFRRGLVLLALLAALGGCSSAAKKHYLKHLSTTIAPVSSDSGEAVAAAGERGAAVADAGDRRAP
jgi:hypothetical protein